ncbi:MAG: hypothetical protein ACI934_001946 [Pseudohongiellaceae bacterium]|jgi:hypothetical protein
MEKDLCYQQLSLSRMARGGLDEQKSKFEKVTNHWVKELQ